VERLPTDVECKPLSRAKHDVRQNRAVVDAGHYSAEQVWTALYSCCCR